MRMRTGSIVLAIGAASLLSASTAAARTTVTIKDIQFSKDTVRVSPGAVVIWKDADSNVSHNVTSKGEDRFASSDTLQSGDSHRVRFRQSGNYRYVCTIHPASMRARIVVR